MKKSPKHLLATSSRLAGLKDTTTGDTLCDPQDPVVLETMTFPDPVIEIAVEPKTKADQEKMGIALQRLAAEDPSFRVETDIESGQTIMKGMGELHLDILVDRMKREFKVEANIGAPQVAYRETIGHEVEHTYTHKKQSGGSGQFGEVKMIISPTEPGEGYSFESESLVVRFQRNTSRALKKASSRSWTAVLWLASR